jgi:hypothetical protein
MPRALCGLLGSLAVLPPLAAQERIDRRIAISPDASIRVLNLVGSIKVTGWDKDTLAVIGRLASGAGKLYFGGSGRAAKLGVEAPEGAGPENRSDLEVRVPSGARLWIKGASADIEITDFRGGLDVYSVSGSVTVSGAPKQVYAESMDGSVAILGDTPFARVKTASGNIAFTGNAEDVAATTVGGSITVRDEGFRRGRFETVTGDIAVIGALPHGASLTAESHSGKITVLVSPDAQADFYINNFQGAITNEISPARATTEKSRGGQELAFELGQGGADVVVRNFKGEIILKRRR